MESNADVEIASLIRLAIERQKAVEATIVPMSEEEIGAVEEDQGVTLPRFYREFLRQAGGRFGVVCAGADMYYPEILGLRIDAQELLDRNNIKYRIGAFDFPFHMWQGYYVAWMSGEGDNPPVYGYGEFGMGIVREADSFSAWVRMQINSSY
jgi:SMI1 / KNR4 family (SUKH-1)